MSGFVRSKCSCRYLAGRSMLPHQKNSLSHITRQIFLTSICKPQALLKLICSTGSSIVNSLKAKLFLNRLNLVSSIFFLFFVFFATNSFAEGSKELTANGGN